jgi:hypothetical protein
MDSLSAIAAVPSRETVTRRVLVLQARVLVHDEVSEAAVSRVAARSHVEGLDQA